MEKESIDLPARQAEQSSPMVREETAPEPLPETMIFELTVPDNTPVDDLIFLRYWNPTPPVDISEDEFRNTFLMKKVALLPIESR